MNDLSIYFRPLEINTHFPDESIGSKIISHTEGNFPDIKSKSIALFFCPEDRASSNDLDFNFEETINYFLGLNFGEKWNFEVYNLGVVNPGNEISDTYFAVKNIIKELTKNDVLPIILGGSQDLTYPVYQAFQGLEQMVNLACIDYKFDLGNPESKITEDGYISQILMHRPCYLFNVSCIGVQMPYLRKSEIDLFDKLYFDVCRLGEYNSDYKVIEPLLRNSDILSLDLLSIKGTDYISVFSNPNGFYAEQICQISKYAGISDKLSVFGLFNCDNAIKNSKLISEIIWYFLDGVAQRKGDFPIGTKRDYTKFVVHMEDYENDLVFYKSPKSDRWWLEVPYPNIGNANYERHHLVPCTFADYEAAMRNELPNLWWKTYQKLV